MLVVSLSAIPPRFPRLDLTLRSILAQSRPADRVLLYIPRAYRRFPDWNGVLPKVPEGVEIRRCETDLGPASKVLPAAMELQGEDCDLLFCDDDKIFHRDWIARFLAAKARHPGCAIAQSGQEAYWLAPGGSERALQPRAVRRWRITDIPFQFRFLLQDLRAGKARATLPDPPRRAFKRSGYIDIFEGGHGVLVRPEWFAPEDCDIPPVIWSVDDVWLSGMVARKGIPIWLDANVLDPIETMSSPVASLNDAVLDGVGREDADATAVTYMRNTHGLWL